MIYVKNISFVIITFIVLILTVVYPTISLAAAHSGLSTFATVIVPTMFPFFVGVALLQKSGLVRVIAALLSPLGKLLFGLNGYSMYAYLSAVISGCPTGAKVTAGLLSEKLITEREAEHISCFTVMAGPMFIFGTIAATLLMRPEYGLPLFIAHTSGALLCGIVLRFVFKSRSKHKHELKTAVDAFKIEIHQLNIARAIEESVLSSVKTLFLIGGIIIVFSVLTAILSHLGLLKLFSLPIQPLCALLNIDPSAAPALVTGAFEMTAGCVELASMNADLYTKLVGMTLIIGFSGFSIISQVRSVLTSANIGTKFLLLSKIIQCTLSVAMIKLLVDQAKTQAVFYSVSVPLELSNSPLLICLTLICTILIYILARRAFFSTKARRRF